MHNTLKKLLSLALSLAMCSALAVTALADNYDDIIVDPSGGYDDVISGSTGESLVGPNGRVYYWYDNLGWYDSVTGRYYTYDQVMSGSYDDVIVDPSGGYDGVIVPGYTPSYASPYVSITSGSNTYENGNSFTVGVSSNVSTSLLSWEYNSDYLTHNGNGRFTVRYTGTSDVSTRITVRYNDSYYGSVSDSLTITLRGYRDPLSVSLSNITLSMAQNETRTLSVNVSGGVSPYTYDWSSENVGVARVSGSGSSVTVTAVNSGTTRIAVTVRDKNSTSQTLRCEVSVAYKAKNGSYNATASATVGSRTDMGNVASAIAGAWANQIGGTLDYNSVITLGTVSSGYGSIVYNNGTTVNSNVTMSTLQTSSFEPKAAGTFTTSYTLKNNSGDTLTGSITITIAAAPAQTTPVTTAPTTPVVSTTPKELVGKAAGEYFSTDIVTTVNGTPIESINVGGRTLISAEDLAHHGFNVSWNGTQRTLTVSKGGSDLSGSAVSSSSGKVGAKLGDYYYTDIVTYLDGKAISAYNTGGRTFFCAEDMSDYGYSVVWNGTARTLTVTTR